MNIKETHCPSSDWIERWIKVESEHAMIEYISTPFELDHLLSMLARADLHHKFAQLYDTHQFLKQAELVDLFFSKTSKSFVHPEPDLIIEKLAEKGIVIISDVNLI